MGNSNPVDESSDDENSIGFFHKLKNPHRERSREKNIERPKKVNNENNFHQKPFKRDLCKYFLNGVCTKGDKCTYSHVIKDFPCKYYVTLGNCDNKDCRYVIFLFIF